MALAVKKPKRVLTHDKVRKFMELRGIADWLAGKLDVFHKPVASVPNAPNFIELMGLDLNKEELLELVINICADHWDKESELDESLVFLESEAGKKLIDRNGELSQKLNTAFDDYIKTKLDEKAQEFKRSTMQ
jgi:hypothetical protein